MSAISLIHIPAILIELFGVFNLLHQFLGLTVDIFHFIYFIGQQNFSGVLQTLISIGAIVVGLLIHVGIFKLESSN